MKLKTSSALDAATETYTIREKLVVPAHDYLQADFGDTARKIEHIELGPILCSTFYDAFLTKTGLVISNDGLVISETLEGSLDVNYVPENILDVLEQNHEIPHLKGEFISASIYGTFNYSVFLHEVLPKLYLGAFAGACPTKKITMHFSEHMSKAQKAQHLKICSTFLPNEALFEPPQPIQKVDKISVFSVGQGSGRRVSQTMIPMTAELSLRFRELTQKPIDKIYISREVGVARYLINREEVHNFFRLNGFEIIEAGRLTIEQQISIFSNARVIVAEHGAALANLWFCQQGCLVVEITPTPISNRHIYKMVSSMKKLKYFGAQVEVPEDWVWNSDALYIPIELLQSVLDSARAAYPSVSI
ncbi:glycosyltransferase family 61 protein [Pigmentiphaga aceris]|uniref:glycosyltransferase family 61 protein n=1 Tax=Pigmentiphaga aceris TaxID=1940612 RepID=UPI00165291CC|nr:glycosyltransferase 61 family protein [Pigmentiphaga aceris]